MGIPRMTIWSHDGSYLCDLDPRQALSIVNVAEVNGEHALVVSTMQPLTKGMRILWRDGMGVWHENVVDGATERHGYSEYYCPWSVQYDLAQTYVSVMPGTGGTPATATQALVGALSGTARWVHGTVGPTKTGSASFYRMSGWEALQELVAVWGGEVSVTITAGGSGVTGRAVNLLNHVGASTPTRRFDYGHDLAEIVRTVSDQPWTARVIPMGAAMQAEGGGYGRKVTIEDVNSGVMWLEDADAVPLVRVPDGNGGWEVPVQIVENPDISDADELKAWAAANLHGWTQPKASYEATVVQLAAAGLDPAGVSEGDECYVVDRDFGPQPIRIQTRLLRMEENLLDRSQSVLTFSNLADDLSSTLGGIASSVAEVQTQVTNTALNQSTSAYVSALIGRLNAEANATGGYTYITEGQGTRTYDVAVSDPLVGAEASKVVEIKGGTIRIADTKDSGGNWQWKTLITSGVVNSELIRAITSGSGWVTQMTSSGMEVYNGLVSQAFFGSTARIGATSGTHITLTPNKLGMAASDGNEALVLKTQESSIQPSSSSTGQLEKAYGARITNDKNMSFIIMSPATALDANDKMYFTDYMSLGLYFASVYVQNGMTIAGDVDLQGDLTLPGNPLAVGQGGTGIRDFGTIVASDEAGAKTVANATNTSITFVDLSKGTWLVKYGTRFDTNGTGRRLATLGTAADTVNAAFQRYCGSAVPAVSGGSTCLTGSMARVVTASAGERIYLTVYQDSGGSLDVTCNLQAIRIC